jgi:hypothetical protein
MRRRTGSESGAWGDRPDHRPNRRPALACGRLVGAAVRRTKNRALGVASPGLKALLGALPRLLMRSRCGLNRFLIVNSLVLNPPPPLTPK